MTGTFPDEFPVLREVAAEWRRAGEEHGRKSTGGSLPPDSPIRLAILVEKVGEVARAYSQAGLSGWPVDRAGLRKELIQVAAMVSAWAAKIPPGQE